jgi:hypothetical protein
MVATARPWSARAERYMATVCGAAGSAQRLCASHQVAKVAHCLAYSSRVRKGARFVGVRLCGAGHGLELGEDCCLRGLGRRQRAPRKVLWFQDSDLRKQPIEPSRSAASPERRAERRRRALLRPDRRSR